MNVPGVPRSKLVAPGLVIEGASVFVRVNVPEGDDPPVDAAETRTWKSPGTEFAVKAGAVATPDELVTTTADVPPPTKVPLAPASGAVNVTGSLTTEVAQRIRHGRLEGVQVG